MTEYPSMKGAAPNPRRAEPFGRGNTASTTHGGKSSELRVSARAQEIADGLRPLVPSFTLADEPTLRLLAAKLARIELVSAWLDRNGLFDGRSRPRSALTLLEGFEASATRLIDKLRLPAAHAQTEPTTSLAAHLAARYGGGE
jgi:hypothetical protein